MLKVVMRVFRVFRVVRVFRVLRMLVVHGVLGVLKVHKTQTRPVKADSNWKSCKKIEVETNFESKIFWVKYEFWV